MARDDYDVNDSSTYTPREAPRVLKAPPRGTAVEIRRNASAQSGSRRVPFRRAGGLERAAGRPAFPTGPRPRAEAPAAVDPANPYAKNATPPRGAGARRGRRTPERAFSFQGTPGAVRRGDHRLHGDSWLRPAVFMMPQIGDISGRILTTTRSSTAKFSNTTPDRPGKYKYYRDYLQQDMIYQGIFCDNYTWAGCRSPRRRETLAARAGRGQHAFCW